MGLFHDSHQHKDDPLWRSRRRLTKAHERLNERGEAKLLGLLAAGDPKGEIRDAWHAKETVRGIYAGRPNWALLATVTPR